ncbi:MAG: restriction endonuclease subunit S, partial [Anaerolineae bacterium]
VYLAALLHDLWRRGHFLTLCNKWVGQAGINVRTLAEVEIPLPPLDVQRQIVTELDGYRKIIEGARQVIANYKPTIRIDPSWPRVKLGDAAEIIMGQSPPGASYNKDGIGVPLINGPVEFDKDQLGQSRVIQYTSQPTKLCKKGDLLVCVRGATTGRTNIASCDACVGRGVAAIRAKNQQWINWVVSSLRDEIYRWGSGSTFANITTDSLSNIEIPLPSEEDQTRICSELETERALIDANRELVELFEQKSQDKLAEIWGEAEQTA